MPLYTREKSGLKKHKLFVHCVRFCIDMELTFIVDSIADSSLGMEPSTRQSQAMGSHLYDRWTWMRLDLKFRGCVGNVTQMLFQC